MQPTCIFQNSISSLLPPDETEEEMFHTKDLKFCVLGKSKKGLLGNEETTQLPARYRPDALQRSLLIPY